MHTLLNYFRKFFYEKIKKILTFFWYLFLIFYKLLLKKQIINICIYQPESKTLLEVTSLVKKKERKVYLVAKANTQNSFLHGIQFLEEIQQLADPNVIAMSIIAASSDDKPIKQSDLFVFRKLTRGNTIHFPCLTFLSQHSHKHTKIPSVHFLHIVRVLCAQKNSKSFATHCHFFFLSPSLSHTRTTLTLQKKCVSLCLKSLNPSIGFYRDTLLERERERLRGRERGAVLSSLGLLGCVCVFFYGFRQTTYEAVYKVVGFKN